MTRVLITGATGFIGRHALPLLLERGYEVHALYAREPLADFPAISWHRADLLDKKSLNILKELRPELLVHLAWYVKHSDYKTSSENEHWKTATMELLRAFCESGGKRALLAGTAMEYSPEAPSPLKEDAPTEDVNAYGKAKNETREAALSYAKESGLALVWARMFNMYGPFEAPTRLVPQIINCLFLDTTPSIPTGGIVRDYSYVKDVAHALVATLDGNVNGAVNIASGKPVTLKEIAQIIADIMGKRELVEKIPDALSDEEPEKVVADITRLTEDVGFRAHYNLDEGLRETIQWWQAREQSAKAA